MTVFYQKIESTDPRLGRHIVHDSRSRGYVIPTSVDPTLWRDVTLPVYDPVPHPNQQVACCTGCAKAMQFNTRGNRQPGYVYGMDAALDLYRAATRIDPFEGEWEPTDTGSSGLASAKAAQAAGVGGDYHWIFGGADEIVQNIMEGRPVSVGTFWYDTMFSPDQNGFIAPTGNKVGGHQWLAHGYNVATDAVLGRCWWGSMKDFWVKRSDLQRLVAEWGGDAHTQVRLNTGPVLPTEPEPSGTPVEPPMPDPTPPAPTPTKPKKKKKKKKKKKRKKKRRRRRSTGSMMTEHEIRTIMVALARLEQKVDGLKDDIENLNGFRDWAVRLVVGAVVLGLIGMLWAQGK